MNHPASESRDLGFMREHQYFVYMLTNCSRHPIYTGVAHSLLDRLDQHRHKVRWDNAYTTQYNLTRLVYFERFQYIKSAIAREKQIKRWSRAKKVFLVEKMNPRWDDLSRELTEAQPLPDWSLENRGPSTALAGAHSARDDKS